MRVEAFLVDLEAWLFLAQKLHHYQAQKFLARRAYRLSVFSQRETISSRNSNLAASSLDGAPQRLAEKAHIATAEFCRASARATATVTGGEPPTESGSVMPASRAPYLTRLRCGAQSSGRASAVPPVHRNCKSREGSCPKKDSMVDYIAEPADSSYAAGVTDQWRVLRPSRLLKSVL
jgi:hypothetical protein